MHTVREHTHTHTCAHTHTPPPLPFRIPPHGGALRPRPSRPRPSTPRPARPARRGAVPACGRAGAAPRSVHSGAPGAAEAAPRSGHAAAAGGEEVAMRLRSGTALTLLLGCLCALLSLSWYGAFGGHKGKGRLRTAGRSGGVRGDVRVDPGDAESRPAAS